ncbi:ABC transporter permease [Parachryseolinea silvisoli]|uniref:ABC transporter permease n=1 Tax=Parachryseolinea silvisoli TaxID=2873601 RepID=UPI002265ADC0|nr:ABC transporter permease [Parachryseolinea silvisoli]MCD9014866.1 ABC transporter permease [Parachryseolinea silvisoli]
MLKNYIITALRSLRRNTVFSVIHVLGLAIGLSAALVIFLIARHEFSYDRFLPAGDRVYRIAFDNQFNGHTGHTTAVPGPLPAAVRQQVPGVELIVPVLVCEGSTTLPVAIPSEHAGTVTPVGTPAGIVYTTPEYFTLIPFEWVAGNAAVLQQPYTTVLTESRAQQYFPGVPAADLVGREILYGDSIQATVAGIVRDLRDRTDFTAVEFISYATLFETIQREAWSVDSWSNWSENSKAYLRLHAAISPETVARQVTDLLTQHREGVNRTASYTNTARLQPLADIHFNPTYAGTQRTASRSALYALLGVAAFLLLLGCVNFINLSTAQAARRAKEIGIRKTVGGHRAQIVRQFLVETLSITTLAMIVSLVLAPFLLRVFAGFMPLSATLFINIPTAVYAVLLMLVVSMLAGFYPALVLSGVRPALILRGRPGAGGMMRTTRLRKMLTVSQFMIAQFFIIAALVVSRQVDFSLHQDLGYRQEAILNFALPPGVRADQTGFINSLQAMAGVERVSSGFIPPAFGRSLLTMLSRSGAREDDKLSVQLRFGDANYIPLYGIQLVAGRNIREVEGVAEVAINETCARALGYTEVEEAIGEELTMVGDTHVVVVGIMKDFYQRSTHTRIDPVVLKGERGDYIHVALRAQQPGGTAWPETIRQIEAAFHALYPQASFSFTFFDESIASFYQEELQTATMLTWATGLSILISCMGLLGLVIYTAEIRRKEIGIRKILGASITSLIANLSREFVLLVLLAFALAAPIAWYATDRWLESFQYKAPVHVGIFLASGAFLLVAALLTLSFQTIRTAQSNPVDSLRSE